MDVENYFKPFKKKVKYYLTFLKKYWKRKKSIFIIKEISFATLQNLFIWIMPTLRKWF